MSPQIPIARPLIGARERTAVERVLRSGRLAQGPEVATFEREFADLVPGRNAVAVSSGTAAIQLGLLAAGIGPGDEVIVPSFTFAATANAVRLTGATPVFADIEERHFCLDPVAAEAAVTDRSRALMPVHLYGHPADMDRLGQLAERHGLLLIEDAAQAHGAARHGRPAGSWGAFGAFSFYPTKNMTTGEGGMVTTGQASLARQVRLLRNQGMEHRYRNEIVGYNARMTEVHAAIGRVQLSRLAGWTRRRRAHARFLDAHLEGVMTPAVAPGAGHVYHQYTVRVIGHDRDAFATELAAHGVETGVYYPVPVHRLPAYGLTALDLPTTRRAARECLSLPVHPGLRTGDLDRIVTAVNTVAKAGA